MTTTQNTETGTYYIDFGDDSKTAQEAAGQLDKLRLSYRLTGSNKLVLASETAEDLRRQPEDANGGIGDDEDGQPCMWMWGCDYPVLAATGPVA